MKKIIIFYLLLTFIIFNFNCMTNQPIISNGKLILNSNPSGAKVYINDEYKGDTPLELELQPKTYSLKLKKEGYKDYSKSINIERNKTIELSIELEKEESKQSSIIGKWEAISWNKEPNFDESKLFFPFYSGSTINFVDNKNFIMQYICEYSPDGYGDANGEYEILGDSYIKFMFSGLINVPMLYKYNFQNINDEYCLILSNEDESYKGIFLPYNKLNIDIDNLVGPWILVYDYSYVFSRMNTFIISFDDENVEIYSNSGDLVNSDSYSLQDQFLIIFNKKYKIVEFSKTRMLLSDENNNKILFVRYIEFEHFFGSNVQSDLRTLANCLEAFYMDWGKYPIQMNAERLSEFNAGSELLGNNYAKINKTGATSATNEKGPIKYIESLPKDPFDPNGNSYYYQSNSDGSKYVIYSYNKENGLYIYRDSKGNVGELKERPKP